LPPFALLRPTSVHDVVAALDGEANPVLLAGGTDLVAAFNEGLMPGTLIDLSRVAALRRVEHAQGELRIGESAHPFHRHARRQRDGAARAVRRLGPTVGARRATRVRRSRRCSHVGAC
jgi:CO/xanthine dehydrogenase FAD-binding subunit